MSYNPDILNYKPIFKLDEIEILEEIAYLKYFISYQKVANLTKGF